MAIIVKTTFRGIPLDSAYIRLTRLEMRKDENCVTGEFQLHANDKKPGSLDYISIECDYVPNQDPRETVFNALKQKYEAPKDA